MVPLPWGASGVAPIHPLGQPRMCSQSPTDHLLPPLSALGLGLEGAQYTVPRPYQSLTNDEERGVGRRGDQNITLMAEKADLGESWLRAASTWAS